MKKEIITLETQVKGFVVNNILKSDSKGPKAINDITRQVWPLFLKYDINFNEFLADYNNDSILDGTFMEQSGEHVWTNYVAPKYLHFAKELFAVRPTGLGTPNSACGEAELMMLILSPLCKKPKKGDVEYNGKIKEFKNDSPRVASPGTSGKTFGAESIALGEKYGVELHPKHKLSLDIYCMKSRKAHYDAEMNKLNSIDLKSFIAEWLFLTKAFPINSIEVADRCIVNGKLDRDILIKEICIGFFKAQFSSTPGDEIMMFNGDKVTVIEYSIESYTKLFNNGILTAGATFFRTNGTGQLAWYYNIN